MLLTDLNTTAARPAIIAEGGQPRPLRGPALCAALRRASRMLSDPTTPPGAVAESFDAATPSIPPGLSGPVQTSPLSKAQ